MKRHPSVPPLIRTVVVVLACSLLLGVMAGSAAAGSDPPRAVPVELRVGWTMYVYGLNPFNSGGFANNEIWALNYDTLTRPVAATMEPGPGLATSWEVSPDGKTWTFHLRSGVKWQDGHDFSALDVAWTYNFIIRNHATNFTSYTRGISRAAAPDDLTVVFTCTASKADMLCQPIPVLPKHIWARLGADKALNGFANRPPIVGTGPFQVVAKSRTNVRLVENPDYWGAQPAIDEIRFLTYSDGGTMADDLKSGAIDAAWDVPRDRFADVAADSNLKAIRAVTLAYDELSFNCYEGRYSLGNRILRNAGFRRALNWAIDKQAIVDSAYDGFGRPADTVIPSEFYKGAIDWHWSPPPATAYGFDLDTCKTKLDALGFTDTDGDGIRERKGSPIKLRLFTRSTSASSQAAGRQIAGWLRDVGLKVKVTMLDDEILWRCCYNVRRVNGRSVFAPDFDLLIWGWYVSFDPCFGLSLFTTKQIGPNGWSDCNYSNPAYDSLYAQQKQAVDPAARKVLTDQMQEILYTDSPYILLEYPDTLQACDTSRWDGWVQAPAGNGGVVLTGAIDSYLNVHPK